MFRLFRFLKPHNTAIVAVLILIFLQSLANLYLPNLMSRIVDTGIIKGDIPYILEVGAWMILVTVAGAMCSVLASFLASRVSADFGKTLRRQVFTHVENFTLHEFDEIGTASLVTRTTNDITQVQQLVNMMLRMMVMAPMMSIGGIIMAVITDAKLSIIIAVIIPILSLIIYAVLRKGMHLFRAMQAKIDTLNRILRENLAGIRVVRSFNRVEYEKNRFDFANRDLADTAIRVNKMMATLWPTTTLVMNFSTIAVLWFGSIRINNLDMQVGSLMAFLQYIMQIMFALMMVSMMLFMIPRASASASRINQVLDMEPDVQDPVQPRQGDHIRGQVEFRDVTFHYPGAEKPALSSVSFTAYKGEVTAIIGGTGSGKSTLVNLIPRFYDVDSGAVFVDGVNVRDLTQAALRSKIGLVPQKAVLFSGTIRDNIRYGKEDACDAEVQHAAQVAQASDFISELPDGFDTIISQGGTNVSGGQRQRLAIARALIRQPEIYIFDDSFSALDFKTDANLRQALREEIGDAAVFIVAQRVSTVMDAHRILVLEEGRIAGIGTHQELLQTCLVYREIVSSQLSEEEIA